MRVAAATILALVMTVVVNVCPAGAADDPAAVRVEVKTSLEQLSVLGKRVNRTYAPFRRGAPADTARWNGLADLHARVGDVADGARRLRGQVERLRDTDGFSANVTPSEFRRRLARTDSLIAVAEDIGARAWRDGLPDDQEEARLWVVAKARAIKRVADQTVAVANEVAYAVSVTEGIGGRTLTLSVVGILVVFGVLALISLVVGAIRKMDDGWQVREENTAAEALEKEPTIDDTTVVLIAAACATVITGRHRVRRIRRLLSPKQKRTPWSAQGRLILQGSHAVGRKSN